MKLSFVLNGQSVVLETSPDRRAVDLLRGLGALDVKEGCGSGECGPAPCWRTARTSFPACCWPPSGRRSIVHRERSGNAGCAASIQRAFAGHGGAVRLLHAGHDRGRGRAA